MTDTIKLAAGPGVTPETARLDTDLAGAPPQQREAMLERLCQAILRQTDSPRVGEPG